MQHTSNADYIASLCEKLRAACQNAGSPELAEAAEVGALSFCIGDGERAGVTPTSTQGAPLKEPGSPSAASAPSLAPQLPSLRQSLAPQPSEAPKSEEAEEEPSVEEVANAVWRLRCQKRQHDDVREQLAQAQQQLQRLPAHCLLELHGYLEMNLGDPVLSLQVQDAVLKLVEALCTVCSIDLPSTSPDGVLAGSRQLLRDAFSFIGKLCEMEPMTPSEVKCLAPCLLYASQFQKVREREVNQCCEALQFWASSFYFYSNISDQVAPVAQELEAQEALLVRLGGALPLAPAPAAAASARGATRDAAAGAGAGAGSGGKDVSAQSLPEAPTAPVNAPASPLVAAGRSSRVPVGGLVSVPGHRVSLPSTLLESAALLRGGGPGDSGGKEQDASRLVWRAPMPTRSVTAVLRF